MSANDVRGAMERALGMGEVGIQVAAYLNGEQILNESVGTQTRGGAPVDQNSLFAVFSVTKAIVATALHVQAERGLIEYSKKVADYWPEFARHGKESTTVADVLAHRAGIPQMPRGVTPELMLDWDWMIAQIEEFEPVFTPGTTNAYHELVWGWLVGELIRRTDRARWGSRTSTSAYRPTSSPESCRSYPRARPCPATTPTSMIQCR